MSVIVKGMEMPKSCSDCPLNYDMMSCGITGTHWWSDTMVLMNFDCDKQRLYDCPLVEVEDEDGWIPTSERLPKKTGNIL